MRRPAIVKKQRCAAWPPLVLVLGVACSPALDNRQRPRADDEVELGESNITFRNPDLAARYKAAKAAPNNFEAVFAYVKPVADTCMASLVDERCEGCGEGAVRYKRRSELDPHLWPIIEDARSMLEDIENVPGLGLEQMDQLVATKGRLLWLAGRSMEEQTLIYDYARTHPAALAVVRRRLELLRESRDDSALESQCARSRAKMKSASEAARLELLTGCVAFHPDNTHGRSDLLEFANYLPNLAKEEEQLYRSYLVRRCEEKVNEESASCARDCACDDKPGDKKQSAKCKRTCRNCQNETAQRMRMCQEVGEVAPEPAAPSAARRKGAPAARRKGRPGKHAPARRKKAVDPGSGPQQAVL
ncbi:MAG: hypothetical protein JXP73_03940 [Deltaproteobacteria bacterium]|nr:hypothetical protein [Deltaproteobacteria bacterium]